MKKIKWENKFNYPFPLGKPEFKRFHWIKVSEGMIVLSRKLWVAAGTGGQVKACLVWDKVSGTFSRRVIRVSHNPRYKLNLSNIERYYEAIERPDDFKQCFQFELDSYSKKMNNGRSQAAKGPFKKEYTVMPYLGFSLGDFIDKFDKSLNLKNKLTIFYSVIEKLNLISKKKMFHGDIKPDNICIRLNPDGSFEVQFVDLEFFSEDRATGGDHFQTEAFTALHYLSQSFRERDATAVFSLFVLCPMMILFIQRMAGGVSRNLYSLLRPGELREMEQSYPDLYEFYIKGCEGDVSALSGYLTAHEAPVDRKSKNIFCLLTGLAMFHVVLNRVVLPNFRDDRLFRFFLLYLRCLLGQ